jgi:hypothetical protein
VPFDKVVIYPDKVELHKEGVVSHVKVSDVNYIKYCPETNVDAKYIINYLNLVMHVKEVEFRETSWIERVEEGCIVYERPPIEAAAKIIAEAAEHLREASELLSRFEIYQIIEYYEQHKGCSETYTWVTNKTGTKYWYWYLKCPHRTPSSIYLGKNPEGHRRRMAAARVVAEAYYRLKRVGLWELAEELAVAAKSLELSGVAEDVEGEV